ncbi:MAG: ROK family transcriptional regulator [Streptomycetaceae bacterium]|nr:ROK family transcriptional regulator [Mycobacteriaceae bacterium]NUS58536.1 ROK family transcriptional regulator [Streptomycetaceae bacterium]
MSSPVLSPSYTPSFVPPRLRSVGRLRAVVPPELRIGDNAAGAIVRALRQGPLSRDAVAKATGASIATVNRHVTVLLAAGLLRERPDLAESGAIGRPRIPVELDHESSFTVGIHIGAVHTTIIASDLRGRILGGMQTLTPRSGQELGLAAIARRAQAFTDRWRRRRPLWAGVALGGRVDTNTGVVDHPRLDWHEAPVGAVIGQTLGVPVSVAPHVEAMAAAELLLPPAAAVEQSSPNSSSLFFYAREMAGVALVFDGNVHTPSNGPGSLAHLPTGTDVKCECGRVGCLEAVVGDRALAERALRAGIVGEGPEGPVIEHLYRAAQAGSQAAQELLVERAETLGRTVAILRDLLNPDQIILAGQAFTEYPAGLPHVSEAFRRSSPSPHTDIRLSGFAGRIQEYGAAVTSLSALYSDPVAAIRRLG